MPCQLAAGDAPLLYPKLGLNVCLTSSLFCAWSLENLGADPPRADFFQWGCSVLVPPSTRLGCLM